MSYTTGGDSKIQELTQNSFSSNEKKEISNKEQLKKIKELKYKELIQWLEKWGHKAIDKTKENSNTDIQFKAEISPLLPYSSGLNTPLYLEFQSDLDDGFVIRTTFELDKNIESHLKIHNKAKEIEIIYLEIEQLVLPMKINIIRKHPIINLYKVIFYDELKKQYFFDSVNDLINSMTLVIGKWDQKYYGAKPVDTENK